LDGRKRKLNSESENRTVTMKEKRRALLLLPMPVGRERSERTRAKNSPVLAIQRNKHIRRIACLACATYQDSLVHGRVLYTWWWATAVTRLYNIFMHACGSWLGINKPRGRWSCNSCSRIRLALYT
jgi:hypothetical protein